MGLSIVKTYIISSLLPVPRKCTHHFPFISQFYDYTSCLKIL